MKKIGLKLIMLTIVLSTLLVVKTNAQPINIGGGLVIGTDRPNIGLKVNGTYGMDFLLENLSASAAFTFFVPSTTSVTTFNRWGIDIDGHYKFYEMSDFEFYALGGLNIASYSTKTTFWGTTTKTSGVKPGLNVGAGAIYNFGDKMKAFSEFKYVLSNYDQAEITFGVLFEL
jgi:opacity protein-like surface antigen